MLFTFYEMKIRILQVKTQQLLFFKKFFYKTKNKIHKFKNENFKYKINLFINIKIYILNISKFNKKGCGFKSYKN